MTPRRPAAVGRPVLAAAVGDPDHFLGEVFGVGPWRGRRVGDAPGFGIAEIDRIVSSAVRVPAVRMVRSGERVPPGEYCSPSRIGSATLTDVADARKVLDLYRRGATLVLQSLHRTWTPLAAWCAALEVELGWPVQANAYLSPPRSRGLAPHADRHDVLAIQLHGAKTWQVDGLGEVDAQTDDVLYLPSGVTHSARSTDVPSLHLTVGIHRPTAARRARAAAELAMARDGASSVASAGSPVAALRAALRDVDDDEVTARLRRPARIPPTGLLARSISRPELDGPTRIRPRGTWSLGADGDRVVLSWDHQRLYLPSRARPALELLADAARPLRIGDLPELDEEEQLLLARRLLDEDAAEIGAHLDEPS